MRPTPVRDGCIARANVDVCFEQRSRASCCWRSIRGLLATLAILAAAGGCTSLRQWCRNGFKVGPNYAPPPAPVSPAWIDSGRDGLTAAAVQDGQWWTTFDDPVLDRLIESARVQNLDLRAAGTRVLVARAQRGVAVGNLFPQSQAALSAYAHGQISQNLGLPLPSQLNVWADGFNASWELDFWGRFRRNIEAANADLAASVEDYGDTLVLLLAEVATRYVELRTYEARLEFARRNVEIQRGSLKLAEDRHATGRATELDVRQARSSLAQTEALIPPLEMGRRRASNQLCILLGTPVTDLAAQLGTSPIPAASVEMAIGLPADLLVRRPDIRRAASQVAAQSARIGVAEADFYPRLAINGFIGYAARDLSDLFESRSFLSFVIPTLQWNVLNYGRILNNVRIEDARLQGAVLEYQQTVLTAGREVEDALIGFVQSQQQAAKLAASVEESQRFVELVIMQFDAGVTDFNRVFNAQSTLVTLQDQLATSRGNIALNLIQAYRAMGGGWESFAAGSITTACPRPVPQVSQQPQGAVVFQN
ncbi:MAG TPA: TolC family protein [Pirellulales bacterium]|nr:TolC family protein [Pirellulales bacterium]